MISCNQSEKSSSTFVELAVNALSSFWRSLKKTDSSNCLKQRYVVVTCSFLVTLQFTFLVKKTGKWSLIEKCDIKQSVTFSGRFVYTWSIIVADISVIRVGSKIEKLYHIKPFSIYAEFSVMFHFMFVHYTIVQFGLLSGHLNQY